MHLYSLISPTVIHHLNGCHILRQPFCRPHYFLSYGENASRADRTWNSATYWSTSTPRNTCITLHEVRKLSTCHDSTWKHAHHIVYHWHSEQSAASHATSLHGFTDLYDVAIRKGCLTETLFLAQVFGNL